MQYVRSISGSVAKTWNSINPATLSGAIDVIVVEQEDGSLACSPFHVRFGKFSLLQPYEKKVEFRVNNEKQDYAMKLGEGGEAFFVFETSDNIPEALQTSPLVSATSSPALPADGSPPSLQEPEFLDLSSEGKPIPKRDPRPSPNVLLSSSAPKKSTTLDAFTPLSGSPPARPFRPLSGDWSGSLLERHNTDDALLHGHPKVHSDSDGLGLGRQHRSLSPNLDPQDARAAVSLGSNSPPPVSTKEAIERAQFLSKQLADSNIPSRVTESGDLMLDMTGYKSNEDDALRAEVIARKILSEELEGNYDIGALIGADEHGNLWIYSSEEAKEAAMQRALMSGIQSSVPASPMLTADAASDPGYHSEGDSELTGRPVTGHRRNESDRGALGLVTPPSTPPDSAAGTDTNRNYAKTLRLTSDQLKTLKLKPGPNPMSFTVNRATCQAYMYLWRHDGPIVISDIDGTITKSDALGHVLNMIGRDWTHIGVAKLYTEIVSNGYNIMYLTSRSTGQADTTRAYLNGISQDGFRIPKGPVIMSPDRTIAALRRELYIRKPEVFKMACLRDIKNLFGPNRTPFYAGFGNRLTDALSYRSVSIPSNRIFTINSNAEVSLDLLSLSKLKLSYVNMREVVDHYFPSVSLLVKGGGEEFTDFSYWRDAPLDVDEFSGSEDEEEDVQDDKFSDNVDEEDIGEMGDSYISQASAYDNDGSVGTGSVDGEAEEGDEGDDDYDEEEIEEEEPLSSSILEAEDQLTPALERAEDEDTREIAGVEIPQTSDEKQEDTEAAIITGVKGVALDDKEESHQDINVEEQA